tara:strand:- start:211 stop:537 length:327 start_codon:yes stop_codon:yes gene_type:complete
MKALPFTATTETGDKFEISFPLHTETGDAVKVHNLVSSVLRAIEDDIKLLNGIDNGDVLQAVAMALAVRSRMIHASTVVTSKITLALVTNALEAAAAAAHDSTPAGTA